MPHCTDCVYLCPPVLPSWPFSKVAKRALSNPTGKSCWCPGWRFHRCYLAAGSWRHVPIWWGKLNSGAFNISWKKASSPSTYRCRKKPGQSTGPHFERMHCPCPHQLLSQQLLLLLARASRSPCIMEVQGTFLLSSVQMHVSVGPVSHKPRILQVWSEPKTANIIQADLHGTPVTSYWLNQFPLGRWCNHGAGVNADIVSTRMRNMQCLL